MNNTITKILAITGIAFSGTLSTVFADDDVGLDAGFDAALGAESRPEEDKVRDASRRPKEVLEFIGINSGMTVLDVAASGGWYTEVLAGAVGSSGRVIAQNGDRRRERSEPAIRAKAERLGNVTVLYAEYGEITLDGEVDAALTAMNLHDLQNRSPEMAQVFLSDVFKALKPGGVFAVIDHEGSAGLDNPALHRMEAATAKDVLEQAGFVVEAVSEILHNPADDHTLNIRDASLNRNTDRFLIRARKPK
jgi:predicted methyltransferase